MNEEEEQNGDKKKTHEKLAHFCDDIIEVNHRTYKQTNKQKPDRYMRKHVFVASRNRTLPSLSRP